MPGLMVIAGEKRAVLKIAAEMFEIVHRHACMMG